MIIGTRLAPGGGAYKELYNRTALFLKELYQLNINEAIPVITHGGPIRAMLSKILNTSPYTMFERNIDYGEVIELDIDENMLN